jgi:glycosyltransferase involved in cell wall biosynthesis
VTEARTKAAAGEQGSTLPALKLGIAWTISPKTGWGVLGVNLARELLRLPNSHVVALANDPTGIFSQPFDNLLPGVLDAAAPAPDSYAVPFPVFHALTFINLIRPKSGRAWEGSPNIGLPVFEFANILEAGRREFGRYAQLVALSKWNRDTLEAASARNVLLWHQGVNTTRFCPTPRTGRAIPNRFVVFSGGAFQLRKGQDIVVAAFRRFHQLRPDSVLAVQWSSSIPDAFAPVMLERGYVRTLPLSHTPPDLYQWLLAEGLPEGSFTILPPIPNVVLAERLRQCDVALFPNRAEGATNFFAMEAIASGVPTIISANTGHLDLIEQCPSVLRLTPRPFAPRRAWDYHGEPVSSQGWAESDISEIVHLLSTVYDDPERGRRAAGEIAGWAWPKQTAQLLRGLGFR